MGSCAPARVWPTRRGWTSRLYVEAGHSPPRSGDDTASPPSPLVAYLIPPRHARGNTRSDRHAGHVPDEVRDTRGPSPQR
eukprot:6189990-Pleurochrysis_carterae.AAC.1